VPVAGRGHRDGLGRLLRNLFSCAVVAALTACEPQGPKALMEGAKLLQDGKTDQALPLLKAAVSRMSREARAYNFLGLAHHTKGDLTEAGNAYQKALHLNPRLSEARYNFGTLLLQQDQPQLAVNELTAYAMLQGRDVNGWLKLAEAQLRLNRLDAAEHSYRSALAVSPRHIEAINGIGLIQASRRRYVEAIQYFQAAQTDQPNYAPAVLNQAILIHRQLNQKSTALQKYRQYLAIEPRPDQWEAVSLIAQNLADEIAAASRPVTPPPAVTNLVHRPPQPVLTNLANVPRPVVPPTDPARPPSVKPSPSVVAASNPLPAAVPLPGSSTQPEKPPASAPQVATRSQTPPPNPADRITPSPSLSAREAETPPLAVSELAPSRAIAPAQEIVRQSSPQVILQSNAASPLSASEPISSLENQAASKPVQPSQGPPALKEERGGFFSRLNPFRPKPRPEPPPSTVSVASAPPVNPPPAPAAQPSAEAFQKRYAYRQLPRPSPGNRTKAAELVHKGLEAHQDRRLDEEIMHYRSAILTDPSSYDAYFNLGLSTAERGDWDTALASYEHALSIDPDSVSSRFNFATALRQTGHFTDSAREFEKILQAKPADSKTLLALGNLYSQRLGQSRTARQYYLRMLEADPNHPKAAEVRFWLSANP